MHKRFRGVRWFALVALVAGVVAVPSALADEPQLTVEPNGSGLWFVQMNGNPTAAGGSESAAKSEQAAFRSEAKKAGVSFTERYAFQGLWNGLSIGTKADAATLESIKGVKAVYPVETAAIPPTDTISPELSTALAMTGADLAQGSGWTGDGVRVAVMDTGIDLDHADLGGDGVAGGTHVNSRVVAQWDFVGDAFNADPSTAAYNPTAIPDAVADDCNGHGTHVSGIVGANGTVDGVAPGVEFGAYRVFGCGGSTTADIMIAAMERAWQDDMDVLNMSIGSSFNTWPQYPTADAASALQNKGVVVVASIGNSGADGVYSAGAPGVGDNVIGVASYDNVSVQLNNFTVTPAGLTIGYGNAASAPPAPTSGSLPLTKANAVGTVPPGVLPGDDGCAAPAAGAYTGMAVLIRRGTCGFYQKARLAQVPGGASAVVLYNNCPPNCGRFSPTVAVAAGADGLPVTIPVVAVSDTEGVAIHNAIVSGPQTLNWQAGTAPFPNPTGGTISSFSSFGLNAELTLKPDLGAPGGLIRSTYPLEAGAYATISGTSMSSPHVAGAAALLLESNPSIPTDKVRDVLQNSADPKIRFGQTYLDNTHRQGAGMLDIDDSITATTWLKPGKISLGEGSGGTETIELTNKSGSAVTYDVTHEPAAGTTGTFSALANILAYNTSYATASFSSPSVVVPANGSASVNATIDATPVPNKGVYGGYITFTNQADATDVYRVPYAGFKGDYQSINVLVPGLTLLSRLTACGSMAWLPNDVNCYAGAAFALIPPNSNVFDFTPLDALNVPQFLIHRDHQARSLTADVYRASDNKWMGIAFESDFVSRNSGANIVSLFPWDGILHKGNSSSPAADGTYYVKVTVIKALGNPSNAETWQSPNFVVDRPPAGP